jgi:hypothetical protein
LAFIVAIAVAVDDSDVGMMSEAIEEGSDAGSVRKDVIPILERAIGGNEDGTTFITSVDDFVQ